MDGETHNIQAHTHTQTQTQTQTQIQTQSSGGPNMTAIRMINRMNKRKSKNKPKSHHMVIRTYTPILIQMNPHYHINAHHYPPHSSHTHNIHLIDRFKCEHTNTSHQV